MPDVTAASGGRSSHAWAAMSLRVAGSTGTSPKMQGDEPKDAEGPFRDRQGAFSVAWPRGYVR